MILPASGTEPPQHIRHDLKQTKGTEHHERQQVRQPERFLETGEKYYFGDGAEQDYAEAVKWFLKAAEFGTDALRDGMRS